MKLVLIKWIDSHSANDWTNLKELKTNCKPIHCKSVGWLLSEENEHKLIVPHVAGDANDSEGSGSMTIPNNVILEIIELSTLEKESSDG